MSEELETLKKLRPVVFTWSGDKTREVGFISEEVKQIDEALAGDEYINLSELYKLALNCAIELYNLVSDMLGERT